MTGAGWAAAMLIAAAIGQTPPLVGPHEVVVGRAWDGTSVWLLTDSERLVRVSDSGRSRRFVVTGLETGDELWGLARTGRGAWVTLVDSLTVAELGRTGLIVRRWSLNHRYLGLHDAPGGVLLQPATIGPGRRVLEWRSAPNAPRLAVGSPRSTRFGSRTETLARNLVGCGMTRTDEVPCWFNHDPRVHRVTVGTNDAEVVELGRPWNDGPGRRQGPLDVRGPLIDAQVAEDGALWVLLRQPVGAAHTVVRISADGTQTQRQDLKTEARLILGTGALQVRLLSTDGYLVEVEME